MGYLFALSLGVDQEEALMLFKVLLATKQVVVDLDKPIAESSVAEVLEVNFQKLEQHHAS